MKDSNSTAMTAPTHADRESWAHSTDTLDLRLWLRLLTCNTLVENRVRTRMRASFGTTLPRFDLMAQLTSAPGGMKMSELSRRMMVTNGNITGIADQLEREGLVERVKLASDRRSSLIRLTAKGRQTFRGIAEAYEGWIGEIFGQLPQERRELLYELLDELKAVGMTPSAPLD